MHGLGGLFASRADWVGSAAATLFVWMAVLVSACEALPSCRASPVNLPTHCCLPGLSPRVRRVQDAVANDAILAGTAVKPA